MAPSTRPARSISCIPELLCMICEYSTRATCVQIAYSSRLLFQVAMPHIWRELRGVESLLTLIPEVTVICDSQTVTSLTIPSNRAPDFSRYNVYSPLVHSLSVLKMSSHSYKVSSWTSLVEYSESLGRALLPNLKQLIIHSTRCPVEDRINWVNIFLSSSLLDIQYFAGVADPVLEIPESRASALLKIILQRCPNVHTLSIFPEPDHEFSQIERDIIPLVPLERFYEHVVNMRRLRDLTVSKSALQPDSLVHIGLLPALEQLTIHGSSSELVFGDPLPDLLFPSLRYLNIHILDSSEINQIWQMETLVQQLTHVQINVRHPETENELDDEETGLISRLPQLFRSSPCVQYLSIDFDAIPSWPGVQSVTTSALKTVFQLPLRSLTLKTVEIDNFEVFCKQLATSCPGLCELKIPDHLLILSELFLLTHLKQLETLSVQVECFGLPGREEPGWQCSAGALTSLEWSCLDLDIEEFDPDITATRVAVYLLTLWPNLVHYSPTVGSGEGWKAAIHQDIAQIMPSIRAALQCSCDLCSRPLNY